MALTPLVQRHKQLLTTISDEIGSSGELYDNFVEHMKGYAPRGLLNSKKNLLSKFDLLATKGHLKPGKYDVLKTIAEDSGNNDIKELIEKAEEDIKALENGSTDRNKSQLIEAGPSTSRSSSDTVNDSARPAKRQRTDVDSSDPLHRRDSEERGYYDNNGKQGLLLILNSKEDRKGTELDVEKLKSFFGKNELGFEVHDVREYEEKDLTTEAVESCLEDVREHLNGNLGKRYYCFVCVIMSHGNENGIKTRDGLKSIEEIRRFFNNKHMPNFAGRPKVFFIQACRGLQSHNAHEIDDADDEKRTEAERNEVEDEADEIIQVPTDADTLLAYATTKGYRSYRRLGVGSWFITECIDVFKKYYRNDHLEDMLITVREKVALQWMKGDGTKQMPCVWSTLTKRLMFTQDDTS